MEKEEKLFSPLEAIGSKYILIDDDRAVRT